MQRLEKNKASEMAWHQQVIGYIKQQQWQKAITVCQSIIQLQPDCAVAYKILGVVMQFQGQPEDAKHWYTKALEIQPDLAEAHANLGSLYATQQHWEQAITSYRTAVELQPNVAGFYRNLGKVLTQINQIEQAIDCYYQGFCLDPEQVSVGESLSLAQHLLQFNQVEKAITIYSTLAKLYPNSAPVYFHWGKAWSQQEKWQDAINCYRQSLQYNPNASHVYNSLGDALTQVQNRQDAIDCYTQAIKIDPKSCWSYFKLGDVWKEQKEWQKVIDLYRQGLNLNPSHYWPYLKLAEALTQIGDIEDAIATYQQAIKINPNLPSAYYQLGELLQQHQQWNDAIFYYQKALKIDPNLLLIYENLGKLLQQQQQWDDLIALYRQAVQVFPESDKIYCQLGDTLRRQQHWYDAIAALMKALELKTDSFAAYDILANTFDEQGYPEAANVCRHYRLLPPSVIQTFCNYSDGQIIALDAASDVQTIPIHPGCQVKCTPPITSNQNLGEAFQSLYFESSAAFVSIVPNGRAIADPILTSGVFNSQNQLIPELSSGHPEFFLSASQHPPVCELDQNVAFLSVRWGNGGYFHWMFDVVARINLIQKISDHFNPIEKVVVNHSPHPYQIETLEQAGIDRHQIIESVHTPHVLAKNIIVPNLIQNYGIAQWKCEFLRQIFLNPKNPPNIPSVKRIYINRNQAPYRKTLNNQAVIQLLEKYGFQSLCLESLSVVEQAAYLNQAEIVVAPHGAGLTNLTFCQPGTQVIEIFSPGYITPLYWFLSNLCSLEHYVLCGEKLPQDDNPKINPVTRDILVNLKQLEHLLKQAGL